MRRPRSHRIVRISADGRRELSDRLAAEAPLEIQVEYGPRRHRRTARLVVTLRSPGADAELALGFLLSEGIIGRAEDVLDWQGQASVEGAALRLRLAPDVSVATERLERSFAATASCGLCGKRTLESVRSLPLFRPAPDHPQVAVATLLALPGKLATAQPDFRRTGGMHAAALFDREGRLIDLREDIGRHNALDKLLGAALLAGQVPLREHLVLLSGRVGFELVQKASMAGLPLLAAVGAASDLAVGLAEEVGMTLLGFLRADRLNCYAGAGRIGAN